MTEENWRDGIATDPNFAASETPAYIGRGVVALATDPQVGRRAGKVHASWTLAKEYGFTDQDGRQPDWSAHYNAQVEEIVGRGGPRTDYERSIVWSRFEQLRDESESSAEAARLLASLGRAAVHVR